MNLTLEERRESIAKQEMELYGRTLSDDKTDYYERCRKAERNKKWNTYVLFVVNMNLQGVVQIHLIAASWAARYADGLMMQCWN